MLARNLESRSVDGHLAAMHFCFLPVQDSPVSLPSPLSPLLSRSVPSHRPSSHPPSSNYPSNLSFSPSTNAGLPFFLHRALSLTRSLARSPHYSCLPLLLARSLARSLARLDSSSSVVEHRRWCSPSVRPTCLLPQIAGKENAGNLRAASPPSCPPFVSPPRQTLTRSFVQRPGWPWRRHGNREISKGYESNDLHACAR